MAELGQPKNTIDIIKKYDFRFRKKFGQNFLIDTHVLDKIASIDHGKCVGCGRCDDVCPEYISFSHIVNRLGDAMKEVSENAE